MSSIFLTKNQKEFVKFQKDYMLNIKRDRKRSVFSQSQSGLMIPSSEHNTDNVGATTLNPDDNDIDNKLFYNIVDYDWLES